MASLQIHASTISALAEHIVEARRLYGPDSPYVLGLFQGIELLLDKTGGSDAGRPLRDEVIRQEGASNSAASSSASSSSASASASAGPADAADASGQTNSGNQGQPLEENSWIRGAVKWFNNDKGYGFISTAADADVFVHWRDISSWDRSLAQGDEVEFMVTRTAKGYQAINVMKPGAGDGAQAAGGEVEPSTTDTQNVPATETPSVQASPTPAAPAEASPTDSAAPSTQGTTQGTDV